MAQTCGKPSSPGSLVYFPMAAVQQFWDAEDCRQETSSFAHLKPLEEALRDYVTVIFRPAQQAGIKLEPHAIIESNLAHLQEPG